MELLAGEANFLTEVNERGIKYKLDFSKVKILNQFLIFS